jgi:ATP adenylyltransferase
LLFHGGQGAINRLKEKDNVWRLPALFSPFLRYASRFSPGAFRGHRAHRKPQTGFTPAAGFYTERDGTSHMDQLWTPWRFAYVSTAESVARPGVPASLAAWPGDEHCVFCNLMASIDYAIANGMDRDEAESAGGLILRGKHCFICLNAFPYTSGHVMAMPYAHLDRLAGLPAETAHELIDLAQRTERVLERLYHPQGFNFGMNVGQAAGAGVAGHLHLHGLPRWTGDTNFMTTVAETRILPEDLETTWKRMREAFAALAG